MQDVLSCLMCRVAHGDARGLDLVLHVLALLLRYSPAMLTKHSGTLALLLDMLDAAPVKADHVRQVRARGGRLTRVCVVSYSGHTTLSLANVACWLAVLTSTLPCSRATTADYFWAVDVATWCLQFNRCSKPCVKQVVVLCVYWMICV